MEAPRRPNFSVGVFSQCMKGQRIRYQQTGEFHFLTFSSFRRRPYLSTVAAMELFEDALERVRLRYLFVVAGYVVMPEHVHLLVNEPARGLLSRTVQALKLSVSMRSRRVAPVPVRSPVHAEGAPGPSLLGTGDGRQVAHSSRYQKLCPVHRGLIPMSGSSDKATVGLR
jgi:REP element-mobilizing transposase RayT